MPGAATGPNQQQTSESSSTNRATYSSTTRLFASARTQEKEKEEEEEEEEEERKEQEEERAEARGVPYGGGDVREDGGPIPTEEELEEIVSQRGQELARMNGAASHLALAHTIWGQVLRPGGIAVDATCGNGHDALAIAKFLFPTQVREELCGHLHCLDIQEVAIQATKTQLMEKAGTSPTHPPTHPPTQPTHLLPTPPQPQALL